MKRVPLWTSLVALALFASPAMATELQTGPTDPNAPPPVPPPMPPPGQPGSATPPPPPGSTAAHLEQSSTEDTGVGLHFVYLQPEVGFGFATLGNALPDVPATSINVNPGDYRSGVGPIFGAGIGGEFITFQLGGRFRALTHKNFNLYNIGGEINYQPGSGRLWPRIGINAGYVWAGSFNKELPQNGLIDVNGFSLGARAGLQYFVTSTIEIGADLTAEALLLKRRGINGSAQLGDASSGTGAMIGLMAHIGFHYP